MKKTIISTFKMAAVVAVMASCNNSEEAAKLQEADNAAIQTAVDAQLAGLQEEVNVECTALVDSLANAKYTEWYELESKKPGKKPAVKPKPKPAPVETKKDEPKKEETKEDRMGGEGKNTAADKASRMGGTGGTGKTGSSKADRMGGTGTPK